MAWLTRIDPQTMDAASIAALEAIMTAMGASWDGLGILRDADGSRLAVLARIDGIIEHLAPQSRVDGGFATIASVTDGMHAVIGASDTLVDGCRVRLWDVSGGAHLDVGGVEAHRDGTVLTLPDTTGLAAGDVVYSCQPDFTSYAAATALEVALGTSYPGEIRLINAGTGAVILRRIVRLGAWASVEVNFEAVTATPTGAVSAASGTTITLSAGHTVATIARVLRWQDVTAGTWADIASGDWSVSGNDVTAPAITVTDIAAALTAGHTVRVHVEGVSELSIGASPCALRPAAGFVAYFTGSGLFESVAGTAARCVLPLTPTQGMRIVHGAPSVGASADDRVTWGVLSGAVYALGGYGEDGAGDARVVLVRSAGATAYSASTPIVYADQAGVDLLLGINRAAINSVGAVTASAVAVGTTSVSIGRVDPANVVAITELQAASVLLKRIYV